ncbi:uncharacterized protein [Cicer arietinum]|uniref:Transcription factor MYB8-like n=1 Tax=Cicer arietinum TaxID=3827 RepID=A0A1S2YVP2_CICAR|nr:transcription factor MYB8-like [Cicer arietinum]
MGRAPCCAKVGLHKGPWTPKEDTLLTKYVQAHGEGQWKSLPKKAGLLRCGKSCRLRWMNYLRPDIKRGNISPDEDDLIIRLHSLLGNRWSLIAGRLPGRTDNEIKNYWNTYLCKKMQNDQQKCDEIDLEQKQHQVKNNNKKKKSNKQKKSEKNKGTKNGNNIQEEEKIQVYLPKPIRIKALTLPRTDSGTSTLESNSSIASQEKEGTKQVVINNNNNNNNVIHEVGEMGENDGFGFSSDDHDLVNEIESGSFFDTCNDHGMLEKLYDEYLQLLNLDDCNFEFDSFAESFFD